MSFQSDTAVTAVGGHFEAVIAPGWDVVGNANGGYLMTIAARAMAAAAGRPHPVSMTSHFLSPGRPGPVSFEPEVLKEGRTFTTVRGNLRAGDRVAITTLGTFSDLEQLEGPALIDATPPDLPRPSECIRVTPNPGVPFPPPMMDNVELRLHPEDLPGGQAGDSSPAFRGWLRPLSEDPLDVFFSCWPSTASHPRSSGPICLWRGRPRSNSRRTFAGFPNRAG